MTDEEIEQALNKKFGPRKCFWGEFYDTLSALKADLVKSNIDISAVWIDRDLDISLATLCDNNGWSCIVVIRDNNWDH